MSKIILTSKDNLNYMPPCYASLHNFTGILYHQEHDLPHPAIMMNNSWNKFVVCIENFLNLYEEKFRTSHDSGKSHFEAASSYENILYRATELIENMEKNIKKCILKDGKNSVWKHNILERWIDHPRIACNKIKHNNNFLVSIEGEYRFGISRGYAICHHINESVKPNKIIHKREDAFPYGNDLRRIISNIYLIAKEVSILIDKISSNQSKENDPIPFSISFDKILMERISNFMPIPFHYQKSKDIPKFSFTEEKLHIDDYGGNYIPNGGGVMKTYFSGDGYTRSYHIF